MFRFVSGVAGTGKTFLIDTIANEVEIRFRSKDDRPAVLLCAPTGLAAVAIRGHTIHSLFSIDASKTKTVSKSS